MSCLLDAGETNCCFKCAALVPDMTEDEASRLRRPQSAGFIWSAASPIPSLPPAADLYARRRAPLHPPPRPDPPQLSPPPEAACGPQDLPGRGWVRGFSDQEQGSDRKPLTSDSSRPPHHPRLFCIPLPWKRILMDAGFPQNGGKAER